MTLTYSEIMIRYGELSTKGKNRMRFINKLRNNIQDVLSIYPAVKVTADRDRAHAYLHGTDYEPVAESLKQVFGIQNFHPVYKIEKSVPALKAAVQEIMKEIYKEGLTFKISSKRSDHTFELDSRELNQTLGGAVFEAIPTIQAQMKKPDINLQVEIREEAAYISYETIKGAGGLPVGTAGKVVSLLSSGIDSPVATWMVGRRGATVIPVHFSGRPMTSDTSEYLCQDIIEALEPAGLIGRLYVVPFGEHQREISLAVPQALRVIMYRRAMYIIAQKIAELRVLNW